MARTGLRMMPTFPSSPLKFRTAGFPQYGFKAGLSAGAFPRAAPTCRAFSVCILPSCSTLSAFRSPRCVGVAVRSSTTIQAATPLYPRGPLRPHPTHSQAQRDFTALQLIRDVFAVRFRLGNPRLVPCFHRSFFLSMSPSTTPGSPAAVYTQFLRRQRWPSSL